MLLTYCCGRFCHKRSLFPDFFTALPSVAIIKCCCCQNRKHPCALNEWMWPHPSSPVIWCTKFITGGLSTLRSLRGTWTHNRYLDGSCSSKLTQSSQRLNAASNSTACPETCFLWKVIWRSSGYIPCLIHWLRAESVILERAPDKYLGFLKKYEKVCNVPQLIKGNDKGSSVIQT